MNRQEKISDKGVLPNTIYRAMLIAGLLGSKRYSLTEGVRKVIPLDLADKMDEKSEVLKLSSYRLLLKIFEDSRGATYNAGHKEIMLNTLRKFILPTERANGSYRYPNIRLTAYIIKNAPDIKRRMQDMSSPDYQLSSYLDSLCHFVLLESPRRS